MLSFMKVLVCACALAAGSSSAIKARASLNKSAAIVRAMSSLRDARAPAWGRSDIPSPRWYSSQTPGRLWEEELGPASGQPRWRIVVVVGSECGECPAALASWDRLLDSADRRRTVAIAASVNPGDAPLEDALGKVQHLAKVTVADAERYLLATGVRFVPTGLLFDDRDVPRAIITGAPSSNATEQIADLLRRDPREIQDHVLVELNPSSSVRQTTAQEKAGQGTALR